MQFFVYLLTTKKNNKIISYVGYTNNLIKRIKLHNDSKGAKFTKGRNWKLVYYEIFLNKSDALKREHHLKKNRKLRNIIKKNYIKGISLER
jgi:putative endonuclease